MPGNARQALLAVQATAGNRAATSVVARSRVIEPAQAGKLAGAVGDDMESLPVMAGRCGGPVPGGPEVASVDHVPGTAAPRLVKKTVVAPTGSATRTPSPAETMGGMGYATQSGPTSGQSGSYKWVVQWKLDKPSPKGGWIVQRVDFKANAKESDATAKQNIISKTLGIKPMKKVDLMAKLGVDPASLTRYWEAWPVNPGQSVTTYAEGGDLEDDTYAFPSFGPGTKGEVGSAGVAEFYEGLTLPSSFKATNTAPAWILPITRSQPKLKGGTGSIPHTLLATWDSIKQDGAGKADETTKVKTK